MSPEDLPLTHSLFDFQRAVCDRPSHSTWAQHGHPAPGHSDWGQRRITEHRFTAIRHVGTLYLTNKHTLRGLYCTPLVVWFFRPLHWWRMRAYSWRITDKHSLPSWVCPVSTDDRHFFPDFLFFSLYRRRLLPSHGWVIETSHRGEHQTAADCGTHGRPTRGDWARGRRAPHCCCPAGSAAKPPRSGHAALAEMTAHDDAENYLQMFESIAAREGWPQEE